jgi:hypothetical protein
MIRCLVDNLPFSVLNLSGVLLIFIRLKLCQTFIETFYGIMILIKTSSSSALSTRLTM